MNSMTVEKSPAISAVPGVRIIIVDPHPLVREGLRASLERKHNIEVVAEAGDAMAGLYAAARNPGAILLANASLPENSALELVRRFQSEALAGTGVVICHLPENAQLIRHFIDNCGRAFVGQNAGAREYMAAIEAVLAGGIFLSRNLFHCLALDRDGSRSRPNPFKLTDREVEILNSLAAGCSNKEVANLFDLSVRTVEAHRLSIRQKTGANILSELVRVSRAIDSDAGMPEFASEAEAVPQLPAPEPEQQPTSSGPERQFMKALPAPTGPGFMLEKRDAQ